MVTSMQQHAQGCKCAACASGGGYSANGSGSSGAGYPTWTLSQIATNLTRSGYSWGAMGASVTVSYSFPASVPGSYSASTGEGRGFSSFSAAQVTAAERALALWSEVANVKFVKTDDGTGQIRFGNTTTGPAVAWAYYPGAGRGGDVWVNPNYSYNSKLGAGDYGFMTLIHEIGHAIGLSHPGDYNGTVTASQKLYDQDSRQYTVMSYFNHTYSTSAAFQPSTPMIHDILAAQRLYGANMTSHTGNDVYRYDTNASVMSAIWDAGGIDTMDASAQDRDVVIDINQGGFSSIGKNSYGGSARDNIGIAYGADIENAIGGSGADIILGNTLSNTLVGGAGDDRISGGGGDDVLDGGSGRDTYVFAAGWGHDVIRDADRVGHLDFRGLKRADLSFARSGDDLVVGRIGGGDDVKLSGFFTGKVDTTFSADDGGFRPVIAGADFVAGNHRAEVIADKSRVDLLAGQSVNVASLVRGYDGDGDRLTSFRITNVIAKDTSGHFELDGQTINPRSGVWGQSFTLRAEDLSRLKYVARDRENASNGSSDSFTIEAFDGKDWGNLARVEVATNFDEAANRAPVISAADATLTVGGYVSAKSLLSAVDPDGDKIRMVRFMDSTSLGSGNWETDNTGRFRTELGYGYYTANTWQTLGTEGFNKLNFFAGRQAGTDSIQFQVYDGHAWSNTVTSRVTTLAGPVPADRPSEVTAINQTLVRGAEVNISQMFTALDPDDVKLSRYRFRVAESRAADGALKLGGIAQPDGQWVEVDWKSVTTVTFATGQTAGTEFIDVEVFDGRTWSGRATVSVNTILAPVENRAPEVTAPYSQAIDGGKSMAASQLFTARDADGDFTIREFRFIDNSGEADTGYFTVDGVRQEAGLYFSVQAQDLSKVAFVGGSRTGAMDYLQIQAFDGKDWSMYGGTTTMITQSAGNRAAQVTTRNATLAANAAASAGTLFSVSDPDGDAISKYRILDAGTAAGSAGFSVNGLRQAAGTWIEVKASDQLTFLAGSMAGTESFQIQAFDGKEWSEAKTALLTTLKPNSAPVVAATARTLGKGQSVAADSLFTVSDADGDAITAYRVMDLNTASGSGRFVLNGVAQTGTITVAAADLGKLRFEAATANHTSDSVVIQAFDGRDWSLWAPTTITSSWYNNAPVVAAQAVKLAKNATIAVTDVFKATDADGDAIARYRFYDTNATSGSARLTVNGVAHVGGWLEVAASDIAKVRISAGTLGGARDTVYAQAYDGERWSNLVSSVVTSGDPNRAPVVSAGALTANRGASLAITDLFRVTDADGDAITRYRFYDTTTSAGSGRLTVNGVAQSGGWVDVAAADLGKVRFQAASQGGLSDTIAVTAFDGQAWSGYAYARVTAKANVAPVVTPQAATATVAVGGSIAASSLFRVSDADGDAITRYRLYDGNSTAASGAFTVNGTRQTGTWTEVADLSQVRFQSAASAGITDRVYLSVFDGQAWSSFAGTGIATIQPVNRAPVIATWRSAVESGRSAAASELFSVSDADGSQPVRYRLFDFNPAETSGYFTLDGQRRTGEITIEAADLGRLRFHGGAVGSQDHFRVEAFDGQAWSAQGLGVGVTTGTRVAQSTFDGANAMGSLTSQRFVTDQVGGADRVDYHRFTLTQDRQLYLQVNASAANVDYQLYDGTGRQLEIGARPNTETEWLYRDLAAGDYVVAVTSTAETAADYTLQMRTADVGAWQASYGPLALRDTTGVTAPSAGASLLGNQEKKDTGGLLAAA